MVSIAPLCSVCGTPAESGYMVIFMRTRFDPALHNDEHSAPGVRCFCLEHKPDHPDAVRYDGPADVISRIQAIPDSDA